MSQWIDISVGLQSRIPVWPGSSGFHLQRTRAISNGDGANVSHLKCDVHVGTHVDAPLHFVDGGRPVEELDLELLIGRAYVAGIDEDEVISEKTLEGLQIDGSCRRLLLKTKNSELWRRADRGFSTDYVALDETAAAWIVDNGIDLVGIDYLSIQRYGDGPEVHQILLRAERVILEGLDLTDVPTGWYRLICLPILLFGAEGAPARAVLEPWQGDIES